MYLKKIILLSLFSWFCVHSNQYSWDLGNSRAERDTMIKIAVLWSSFWIFNQFISYVCAPGMYPPPKPEDSIWRKIGYGIQGVGCADGLSMITKTTVMTYAAWNLKNYYSHK